LKKPKESKTAFPTRSTIPKSIENSLKSFQHFYSKFYED